MWVFLLKKMPSKKLDIILTIIIVILQFLRQDFPFVPNHQ